MKKSKASKHIIIAITIGLVIVFLLSMTTMLRNSGKSSTYQSVVDDGISYIDRALSAPIRWVESTAQSLEMMVSTYDENEQLKKKLDRYISLEAENEAYKEENATLRAQMKMNETLTSYETITSNVISRSPDNWQNILVIDSGKADGLEDGMPVMGNKGLIGRIIQTNEHSSKVQLLTATGNDSDKFPVMVQTSSQKAPKGLIEGYSKEKDAYIVSISDTSSNSKTNIKKGDKVITSGLGDKSPKGLYVGKVIEVKKDDYGLNQKVYVEPANSLYDVSVVTVVKRLATEGEDNE